MKKIYSVLTALLLLCNIAAFADAPCDDEYGYSSENTAYTESGCPKPCPVPRSSLCDKPCPDGCPETVTPVCTGDNFLCTGKDRLSLYRCLNLSATQICTADKINDKYHTEVYSLNERLDSEYRNKGALKQNCAKSSELRASRKVIKDLKKERRKICECYEKEFKNILSEPQIKEYKKYKKQ